MRRFVSSACSRIFFSLFRSYVQRNLILSLGTKEEQSKQTIESAKQQLEESKVYLVRIQVCLLVAEPYPVGPCCVTSGTS